MGTFCRLFHFMAWFQRAPGPRREGRFRRAPEARTRRSQSRSCRDTPEGGGTASRSLSPNASPEETLPENPRRDGSRVRTPGRWSVFASEPSPEAGRAGREHTRLLGAAVRRPGPTGAGGGRPSLGASGGGGRASLSEMAMVASPRPTQILARSRQKALCFSAPGLVSATLVSAAPGQRVAGAVTHAKSQTRVPPALRWGHEITLRVCGFLQKEASTVCPLSWVTSSEGARDAGTRLAPRCPMSHLFLWVPRGQRVPPGRLPSAQGGRSAQREDTGGKVSGTPCGPLRCEESRPPGPSPACPHSL